MPWVWTDPIDVNTDLQDLSLWNRLIEAIRKRWLCSANDDLYPIFHSTPVFAPDAGAPEVVIPPGEPNKYIPDPDQEQADLTRAYGISELLAPHFQRRSIGEMQHVLAYVVQRYVNRVAFPDALQGVATGGEADLAWTPITIAEDMGYPTGDLPSEFLDPLSNYPVFLRRQHPRRILALDDTTSDDYWAPLTVAGMPAVVAGNRAQWYDAGRYRGIYEYDGTTWAPAPIGAMADILDSTAAVGSNLWCPPGYFVAGDYVGWWLAKDLHELCKRMEWSIASTPYSRGIDHLAGDAKSGSGEDADKATAQATANANMAASSTGASGAFQIVSTSHDAFGDGSYWLCSQATTRLKLGVQHVYGAVPSTVDYYALAQPGQGEPFPDTFDANGFAVLCNAWSAVTSKPFAATTHELRDLESDTLGDFTPATYHDDPDGLVYGFEVISIIPVVKWTFSD
jgi:hypothetical protein